MTTPARWAGLKVHAPNGEQPAREHADARRRQAFARVSAPAATTPPPPPRPTARTGSAAPPAHAKDTRGAGDRAAPTVAPQAPAGMPVGEAEPAATGHAAVSGAQPMWAEPDQTAPLEAAPPIEDPQESGLGAALVAYVSNTVTSFCNNPAVRDADGWHIRIELNAHILAATTLHLKLTLNWLILRFECRDAQARNLVSAYRVPLTEALEAAVTPRREVSIDVA